MIVTGCTPAERPVAPTTSPSHSSSSAPGGSREPGAGDSEGIPPPSSAPTEPVGVPPLTALPTKRTFLIQQGYVGFTPDDRSSVPRATRLAVTFRCQGFGIATLYVRVDDATIPAEQRTPALPLECGRAGHPSIRSAVLGPFPKGIPLRITVRGDEASAAFVVVLDYA